METGKTPSIRKEKVKPTFVTVGTKQIISSGRWNDELMVDYVLTCGEVRWIPVGELARVAWGQNNIANKRRVRYYLSRLWKLIMVKKGRLLSVEYAADGHHPALAIKLYDPANETERLSLQMKIDKLQKSKELTEAMHDRALEILAASPPA